MLVRDVMEHDVLTVHEDTTVREVLALIVKYQIRDFPVVDHEAKFLGMIYVKDLLQALYPKIESFSEGMADFSDLAALASRFKDNPIRKIMTKGVYVLHEDDLVMKAGSKMLIYSVPSMPVLKEERVTGLITQEQVFKVLMTNILERRAAATEVSKYAIPQTAKLEFHHYEGPEKRLFRRIQKKMTVAYKLTNMHGQEFHGKGKICESMDVSAGGIALLTTEKLNRNDMVEVAFDLYGNEQPIIRLCRVVRCQEQGKNVYEVGLMFLVMSAPERKKMEDFLDAS
jgi:CBS domain-containing protein